MIQTIFFRQKTIEKIKPASACPDHVRQFILDNRPLKHDGCSRHVQRQGTHMLFLISLFQINFRNRRNPSLQRSRKETFMKNHVLHGIPVEHGQKRTEMSGMKHGYAIQQQQVLIVSAPVDHKILSDQRRSHPRQNPYLREQVSPTKSQQIRRSQFSQFIFPFTRLHGNFFYLKQQWFHTGTDKTVSRHPDRLHLRSVAHVRSFHCICSFGYMQTENPFSIRNGIPLFSILILQCHDRTIQTFFAVHFGHCTADIITFNLPCMNHQFTRRYKSNFHLITGEDAMQKFFYRHSPSRLYPAHLT